MTKQFTAAKVLHQLNLERYCIADETVQMLESYAAMLETQEKAVPVAWEGYTRKGNRVITLDRERAKDDTDPVASWTPLYYTGLQHERHPAKIDAFDFMMMDAAAKSGNKESIRLAAQLAGIAPCEKCDFIKGNCQCQPAQVPDGWKVTITEYLEAEKPMFQSLRHGGSKLPPQENNIRFMAARDALHAILAAPAPPASAEQVAVPNERAAFEHIYRTVHKKGG